MQEKQGIIGGEKNNMVKSQPKKRIKIKGCLLHNSDLWQTPKFIYNYYMKKNFFDPCPTNPKFNGLKINWKSFNFVNPPYSEISKWIDKALEQKKRHCNSVFLIPARTDTRWFRKLIENNVVIAFIQGKLHFNEKGPAPFPSMFVWINSIFDDRTTYEYFTKEDIKNYFNQGE